MKNRLGEKAVAFLTAVIVIAGAFSGFQVTAGGDVYVDSDATGTMDGSSKHPYKKIQDAIDKAEKEDKNVKIRKGTYRENISIWGDIEVNGSDKDEVIIIAKNDDEPVAKMYHDTALRDVTVREGEVGIEVRTGAEAMINHCNVIENDEDGIRVKEADVSHKKDLIIINSVIEKNDWSGIYVESRKLKIEDNFIGNNGKDGVDLARKSEGVVKSNHIKDNDGVGIKIGIDGSEIYVSKNTLRDNNRDGIEVKSKGERGFVQIDRNKLYQNDRWGITRVAIRPFSSDDWFSSLKIIADNLYWDNNAGEVAPVHNAF